MATGSSKLNEVTTNASSIDVYPTFLDKDVNSAADFAESEPLCIKASMDIASRKKRQARAGHLFKSIHAFT
jgi:hypothetical protein